MTWQPMETAPKDAEGILAWDPNEGSVLLVWWEVTEAVNGRPGWVDGSRPNDGEWSWALQTFHPTHWMPLPEPPR